MNLHDQGRVDQPRLLEQPFAVLVGIFGAQPVDDRVVLPVEQRVHDREADPPVAVDAGKLQLRVRIIGGFGIERQVLGLGHVQLAVRQQSRRPGAHAVLGLEIGAVDLRAVPPLGDVVAEGRRASRVGRSGDRVLAGVQDGHFRLRPIVARRDRKAVRRSILVVESVAQPVVHHELQPRPQQHVDRRRRDEFAAREQLTADDARIGLVELRRVLAEGFRNRRVAAEARVGHPHPRLRQIVEAAVRRSVRADVEAGWRRRVARRGLGIEDIAVAQVDPQRHQIRHREREGQPIPDAPAVDRAEDGRDKPFQFASPHVPLSRRRTALARCELSKRLQSNRRFGQEMRVAALRVRDRPKCNGSVRRTQTAIFRLVRSGRLSLAWNVVNIPSSRDATRRFVEMATPQPAEETTTGECFCNSIRHPT